MDNEITINGEVYVKKDRWALDYIEIDGTRFSKEAVAKLATLDLKKENPKEYEVEIDDPFFYPKDRPSPSLIDDRPHSVHKNIAFDEDGNPFVKKDKYTLDYMNIPEEHRIDGRRYPEKAFERVKELNKPWPQEWDEYWFISPAGEVLADKFTEKKDEWGLAEIQEDRKKFGNFFETQEEAKMYSLRIESLSKGFMPKEGEDFWIYSLQTSSPLMLSAFRETDRDLVFMPKFPSKKECQEWYDKYGSSWLYLIDKNNEKNI